MNPNAERGSGAHRAGSTLVALTMALLVVGLAGPLALDMIGASAVARPVALGLLGAVALLAALAPVWVVRVVRPLQRDGATGRAPAIGTYAGGLVAGALLWERLGAAGGESYPSLGAAWYGLLGAAAVSATIGGAIALRLVGSAVALRAGAKWRRLVALRARGVVRSAARRARAAATTSSMAAWAALGLFGLVAAAGVEIEGSLTHDIGQYLYVGQFIVDGGAPYVDAANNKGPLTFALFALISLLADGSTAVVQASVVPFAALAALAVAGFVTRAAGRPAGLVAGLAVVALGGTEAFAAGTPNTEHYAIAPMAGAMWAAGSDGRHAPVAAGAFAAAAALINPSFLVILAPLVAFVLLRSAPGGDRYARLLGAGVGVAAVAAPLLVWLALEGALDDMVLQVGDAVGRSVGPPKPGRHVLFDAARPVLLDVPLLPVWALGVGGCLLALADRRLRVAGAVALALVLAVWARARLLSYSFEHYFVPATIGLGAGLGLLAAFVQAPPRPGRMAIAAAVVTLALVALALQPGNIEGGAESADVRGVPPSGGAAYLVAAFVRDHTRTDDGIFVSGDAPSVYWLSDRRAPTPYFDRYSLLLRPESLSRLVRDLETAPPAAIAFVPRSSTSTIPGHLASLIVRHRYRVAYRSRGSRVWLRRDRFLTAGPVRGDS